MADKHKEISPWDRVTGHYGDVNHGPTMGSLTEEGRENPLDTRAAVRRPPGRGLTLRPTGRWPKYV